MLNNHSFPQFSADDRVWFSIYSHFDCPLINPPPTNFQCTQQPFELLTIVRLLEEFVSAVAKSKDLAFKLDKRLTGVRNLGGSPLANQFYDVIWAIRQFPGRLVLPKHDFGENTKLALAVFDQLNVSQAPFTGSPESIIGPALCEGDFINGVITRIREETRKTPHQNKLKQRTNEAKQLVAKVKKLMDRLRENHGNFHCRWLDLLYAPEQAASFKLAANAKHLGQFIDQQNEIPSVLGYFWHRNFLNEFGFRVRLAVFISETGDQDLQRHETDLWQDITNGNGIVLPAYVRPTDPMDAQEEIARIILGTTHLRLEPDQKCEHRGLSSLPARRTTPAPATAPTRHIQAAVWPSGASNFGYRQPKGDA